MPVTLETTCVNGHQGSLELAIDLGEVTAPIGIGVNRTCNICGGAIRTLPGGIYRKDEKGVLKRIRGVPTSH